MQIRDLSPDLILTNGRFHTPTPDPAEAVAIKDGRFLATGSNSQMNNLAGDHTRRLDLHGHTAIPGLFDSHAHLLEVGLKLAAVRLDECQSPEEMMELVRDRVGIINRNRPGGHVRRPEIQLSCGPKAARRKLVDVRHDVVT